MQYFCHRTVVVVVCTISNGMDIRNLTDLNKKINNVYRITLPYWWAVKDDSKVDVLEKKIVVFFGNDMSGILKTGTDRDLYVAKFNECLDYVREKFKDCDFYYKPHPGDENEQYALDLKGFQVVKEKIVSEIFLWKNRNRIRAVFSIGSLSSFCAYNLGLDSHVFYKCFSGVFEANFSRSWDDSYLEMPPSFFVNNLKQEIVNNSRILKKDEIFEEDFKKIINDKTGKIWFVVSLPEPILVIISLSKLIKTLIPGKQVGLIISHHRRWNYVNLNDMKDCFDEVIFFPRVHYSLRPPSLFKALKIIWQVKNFKILSNDILVTVSQVEFIENCFFSYHKESLKIGFLTERDFNFIYNPESSTYKKNSKFKFNKAGWFMNRIFEPLLGLNRVLFLFFNQKSGLYLIRYQKPLNEIFDKVYLMSA